MKKEEERSGGFELFMKLVSFLMGGIIGSVLIAGAIWYYTDSLGKAIFILTGGVITTSLIGGWRFKYL